MIYLLQDTYCFLRYADMIHSWMTRWVWKTFFFLEMTLRESNWPWSVLCSQARGYWSPLCTVITRRSTWTRGTLGTFITRRSSRTLHFSNVGHLKNHFISISRFSWKKKVGSKCVKQRLTTPMLSWSLAHNSSLTRGNILHLAFTFSEERVSVSHIKGLLEDH